MRPYGLFVAEPEPAMQVQESQPVHKLTGDFVSRNVGRKQDEDT